MEALLKRSLLIATIHDRDVVCPIAWRWVRIASRWLLRPGPNAVLEVISVCNLPEVITPDVIVDESIGHVADICTG